MSAEVELVAVDASMADGIETLGKLRKDDVTLDALRALQDARSLLNDVIVSLADGVLPDPDAANRSTGIAGTDDE